MEHGKMILIQNLVKFYQKLIRTGKVEKNGAAARRLRELQEMLIR